MGGHQFDPAFVDAFVTAIERDGWKGPDSVAGEAAGAVGESAAADALTAGLEDPEPDPAAPLRAIESL